MYNLVKLLLQRVSISNRIENRVVENIVLLSVMARERVFIHAHPQTIMIISIVGRILCIISIIITDYYS